MLPADVEERNLKKATTSANTAKQSDLDPHLKAAETPPTPYSDSAFLDVAIEWAIATDQVKLRRSIFAIL